MKKRGKGITVKKTEFFVARGPGVANLSPLVARRIGRAKRTSMGTTREKIHTSEEEETRTGVRDDRHISGLQSDFSRESGSFFPAIPFFRELGRGEQLRHQHNFIRLSSPTVGT